MFLGVSPVVTNWSPASDEFSLLLDNNPLSDFVELPDGREGLYYSNLLCGVLRGALEMVQMLQIYFVHFATTSTTTHTWVHQRQDPLLWFTHESIKDKAHFCDLHMSPIKDKAHFCDPHMSPIKVKTHFSNSGMSPIKEKAHFCDSFGKVLQCEFKRLNFRKGLIQKWALSLMGSYVGHKSGPHLWWTHMWVT